MFGMFGFNTNRFSQLLDFSTRVFLERVYETPTQADIDTYNALFVALKEPNSYATGVTLFEKIDCLFLLQNHDSSHTLTTNRGSNKPSTALINAVNPMITPAVPYNAIACIRKDGVTGNAVDKYIDTLYAPSGTTNFKQNDASIVLYVQSSTIGSTYVDTGRLNKNTNMRTQITSNLDGASMSAALANSSLISGAFGSGKFRGITRSSGTNANILADGFGSSVAHTSGTLSAYNMYLFARNRFDDILGTSSPLSLSPNNIYIACYGAGLSSTAYAKLQTAFRSYVTAMSLGK